MSNVCVCVGGVDDQSSILIAWPGAVWCTFNVPTLPNGVQSVPCLRVN